MHSDPDFSFSPPASAFSPMVNASIEAALQAGLLLKKGFGTTYRISPKADKNDLVTEYDHASEDLIIKHLSEQFPSFSFLCEESGHIKNPETEYCWIVDPLDGTVNFAHNIPLFCVSIALAKNNNIISGVIFEPITQELFVVEKGIGVFLNSKPIKVSQTRSLESAFVSTSLSFNLHLQPEQSIVKFGQMAKHGFPLRALGSTALNLAYIAAGRFDAYWSVGGSINTWDMAAGKLMVEEAGGKITQCDGKPYHLFEESTILATNGCLHEEASRYLQEQHEQ
jgi:myo-inositol-1(or 4)-monophosphatase